VNCRSPLVRFYPDGPDCVQIQLAIRYPYHDSHRRSHRDVLKQLPGIVRDYTLTADGPGRDGMIRQLSGFRLVDHIIQSDLRVKPYVLQMQRMQAETEHKKRETVVKRAAE
jgi:hemerythrin